MQRVFTALRKAGIAERDIQTAGLNLQPQYRFEQNEPPALTGFEASNRVQVTLRDEGDRTGDRRAGEGRCQSDRRA